MPPALPPRFLWIGNPDDPSFYWSATGWFATAISEAGTASWTTQGVGRFALDRYDVTVAAGAALTLAQSEPAQAVFAAGAACYWKSRRPRARRSRSIPAAAGPTRGSAGATRRSRSSVCRPRATRRHRC